MGEGLGRDITTLAFLQPVVADLAGRVQRLLYVARFDQIFAAVRMVGPDAGKAVGLQFHPYGELVVFRLGQALALTLHLIADAQKVLHVVPDLVGHDVGLGEIARCVQLLLQIVVEGQINVDFLIGWAVEGPHGRLGIAAGRIDGAAEQHQFRLLVGLAVGAEDAVPVVFGVGQHHSDQFAGLPFPVAFLHRAGFLRLTALQHAADLHGG